MACNLCPIPPRQLSVDHMQDKQAIRQVERMLNQVLVTLVWLSSSFVPNARGV